MADIEKNNQVAKAEKTAKAKDKKPGFFSRLGGKIKAIVSELKKVTWPSFKTVMKQLGCVLVTVIVALVLILLIDLGLQELLKLVRGTDTSALVLLKEVL